MSGTDTARARPLVADDLRRILQWRNDPSVRGSMLSQHEISWEEHQGWFERASIDPNRRLLLVEGDDGPFGYVGLTGVGPGNVVDWGFYVAPSAPKGSGRRLGQAVLSFAFGELALHKVCGQALGFNQASIGMHLALGFRQEGVLREQHRSRDTYQDLLCFGLLRNEWQAAQVARGIHP